MFTPGQLVVYPTHGVGVVDRLDSQEIGGMQVEFYIVRIIGSNMTLMVPVTNAENVGLRDLSTKEECFKILESLKDRGSFTGYTGQNWNRRYRDYSERLKSGAIADSCHVLKELLLISGEKDLSFGEKRLLEQAMNLVSMEIACVMGDQQEHVQNEIKEMFKDILTAREKS